VIPAAHIRHEIPGRLRIAVPSMRGDADYFDWVSEGLRSQLASPHVTVNPQTAGVLLDGLREPVAALRDAGRRHEWFDLQLDASLTNHERPQGLLQALPSIDQRTLAASAMLTLAVFQAMRGQVMVPAVSLVWYALETVHWLEARP
jgi:hypothetical protein